MNNLQYVITTILFLTLILTGCRTGDEVPATECQKNCYYTKQDCLEGCQNNSAHVTFGWQKSSEGFKMGMVNCHEECEKRYQKCISICETGN